MKIFIVITLLAIIASMGQALFAMTSGPSDDKRVVRALTLRVTLSVGLFLLLLIGWQTGVITPHSM
jgi:hypothetical protein